MLSDIGPTATSQLRWDERIAVEMKQGLHASHHMPVVPEP